MSTPTGNKNRAIAVVVRGLIASYLEHEGIDAVAKPYHSRISDSLDHAFEPDVAGLPRTHLDVSSRLTHRFAEDLDGARRAGAINGAEVSAFVQYRANKDISESFVILGLDHFSKLLRGDHLAPT